MPNVMAALEMAKHRAVWLASFGRRRCSNEAKTRNPLKVRRIVRSVEQKLLFNKFLSDCRSIHALVAKIQNDEVVR